jgi:hypothetical protein
LGVFARVALYSSAVGGNYILDATNLLEFVPNKYSWLVTFIAARLMPHHPLAFDPTIWVGDICISLVAASSWY